MQRGLLVHPAWYMSDRGGWGNSWGCLAMDPHVSNQVIAKIKNGAMIVVWK